MWRKKRAEFTALFIWHYFQAAAFPFSHSGAPLLHVSIKASYQRSTNPGIQHFFFLFFCRAMCSTRLEPRCMADVLHLIVCWLPHDSWGTGKRWGASEALTHDCVTLKCFTLAMGSVLICTSHSKIKGELVINLTFFLFNLPHNNRTCHAQ